MLHTYAVCDICEKKVDITMGEDAYREAKEAVCMLCESCWETFFDEPLERF